MKTIRDLSEMHFIHSHKRNPSPTENVQDPLFQKRGQLRRGQGVELAGQANGQSGSILLGGQLHLDYLLVLCNAEKRYDLSLTIKSFQYSSI